MVSITVFQTESTGSSPVIRSKKENMIGYKLFRQRKDGTLGPLFINRKQKLVVGTKYVAEEHPTKGFAFRPGWHICSEMNAPHLSKKDRVWAKVKFTNYTSHVRPESQGGLWYTAKNMTIIEIVSPIHIA
jgi:hypothetical protein